jgi:5-methylcytosine-specific restriction protein A
MLTKNKIGGIKSMKWMISANGKMYNHAMAFQKWGFIDWRQKANYNVGDIVYIYCTRPYKKVMYKTVVEKTNLTVSEIVDDKQFWYDVSEYEKALSGNYARLKLEEQVDTNMLSLDYLTQNGLKAAPQGPVKISETLTAYIESHMNDFYSDNTFPESDIPTDSYEGALVSTHVNRYERSSISRHKCIEHCGCKCYICGFDFEKIYGEIGKGFIHVHHIVPVSEVIKENIVDYKKDLIPVCPNCHAMLHRKIDGGYVSIEDLGKLVNNNNLYKRL